jgi:hypothetical protein
MLQYPSIPGSSKAPLGKPCIAFYKYDGSNLRWEWSPKKGWNKYGTRRELFDQSHPLFSQAIPIFNEQLADELVYRCKQLVKNPERITAFTEFFGPNSFAGSHDENEPKELRLFDVFLFKKGFVSPKQFVKTFGDMSCAAQVVYEGPLNRSFITDVKTGKYPVFEGVIAKGDDWSVKIKTDEFFAKLRNKFPVGWENYGE